MVFSNVQFFGHMSGMLDGRPAFGHLPNLHNTGSRCVKAVFEWSVDPNDPTCRRAAQKRYVEEC